MTSIEFTNEQMNHANDIVSRLVQAKEKSMKFDDIITCYNQLFSKYLQETAINRLISDNDGVIVPDQITKKSTKEEKEYQKLFQTYEEERHKCQKQLTTHNKSLEDLLRMKNEKSNIEKEITILKDDIKGIQEKYAKENQSRINLEQDKELLLKDAQVNLLFEQQIKTLTEIQQDAFNENIKLKHKKKLFEENLNMQIEQTEEFKQKAEKEKEKIDELFKKKEKVFMQISQPKQNKEPIIPIEIPKTLKLKVKAHDKGITSINFNSIGDNFITTGIDNVVKIWECTNTSEITVFSGFNKGVTQGIYDHSEQYIFAASLDKTAKLWALKTTQLLNTFTGHNDYINCAQSYHTSIKGCTGSSDKTIKEWDFAALTESKTFQCSSGCYALSIFQDDGIIASGHQDGIVNFWANQDKPVNSIELHEDQILSLKFLSNETQFLSLSKDFTLKLFDIQKMQTVYTITDDKLTEYCESTISISSDGRYFAIGSNRGTVYIFNVKDGSLVEEFNSQTGSNILSLQWRPKHSELYIGDLTGNITIWHKK